MPQTSLRSPRRLAAWLPLIVLLCAGTALRVSFIHEVQPPPTHDAHWYVGRAKTLAAGHGISTSDRPTAYRPVGYPVILGAAYVAFGVDRSLHRHLHVVISILTLLCLYFTAERTTGSRTAAYGATLLFACYPTDVAYTSLAVSEPFFNLCMLGGAWAWTIRHRTLGLVLCGVCLFAASMTRATGIWLPVLLGCFGSGAVDRSVSSRLLRGSLLIAIVVALSIPWWVRNARAFGGFVPIANNGGVNLYIGNNPLATGGYRWDRAVMAQLPREVADGWLGSGGPKEYQIDRTLNRLALDYILQHPQKTLALIPAKLRYLFRTDQTAFEWNRSKDSQARALFDRLYQFSQFYYVGLWLLAIAGAAGLVLRGHKRWQQAVVIGIAGMGSLLAGAGVGEVSLCVVLVILGLLRQRPGRASAPWLAYACITAFAAFQLVYFGDARFHHAMMPWVCTGAGIWFADIFS